jgi:hypothetical protein
MVDGIAKCQENTLAQAKSPLLLVAVFTNDKDRLARVRIKNLADKVNAVYIRGSTISIDDLAQKQGDSEFERRNGGEKQDRGSGLAIQHPSRRHDLRPLSTRASVCAAKHGGASFHAVELSEETPGVPLDKRALRMRPFSLHGSRVPISPSACRSRPNCCSWPS